MSESKEPREPLIEVGRYARLAEAREHGLVVAARELPYWIEREMNEWVLCVEASAGAEAARELAAFEREEEERPVVRAVFPVQKIPTFSLYVVAWVLSLFFVAQNFSSAGWEHRGAAVSRQILRGEWWRTITALTLHADAAHIGANLATGLLFAAFALPRFGTGVTWLAIVLSGALGNAINAWGYRGESHATIGASTACFAALGILMGAEVLSRWREPHTRRRWQLVLPLGAGLGLLAFLGSGDQAKTVDYMAHFWGFAVGAVAGGVAEGVRIKERAASVVQRVAASVALALVVVAWWLALR